MSAKLFDLYKENMIPMTVAIELLLLGIIKLLFSEVAYMALAIIFAAILLVAWVTEKAMRPAPTSGTTTTTTTETWGQKTRRWGKAVLSGFVGAWQWAFAARPVVAPAVAMGPSRASVAAHAVGSGIAWAFVGLFEAVKWMVSPIPLLFRGIPAAVAWVFGLMGATLAWVVASAATLVVLALIFSFAFWAGLKLAGLVAANQANDIRLTWLGGKLPPEMVEKVKAWFSTLSDLLPTLWTQAWAGDKPAIFALAAVVVIGTILVVVIWKTFQKHPVLVVLLSIAASFTLLGWYGVAVTLAYLSFVLARTMGDEGEKPLAALPLMGWPFFTLLGWWATTLPGSGDLAFWSSLRSSVMTVPVAFGDTTQTQVWIIICAALAVVDALILVGGSLWVGVELTRKEKPATA
jgi:hypothetical protein